MGDMNMIEVYKIFSGKYDDWLTGRHFESSYDLRNHRFTTTTRYAVPCTSFDVCGGTIRLLAGAGASATAIAFHDASLRFLSRSSYLLGCM